MSYVLLEFQGGETCQGGQDFVKGSGRPPLPSIKKSPARFTIMTCWVPAIDYYNVRFFHSQIIFILRYIGLGYL